MKALTLPLVLTLSGGLAMAAEMPKASKKTEATSSKKSEATSVKKAAETKMSGEVVSTDASANKLVLKTASGEESLIVSGKAVKQLKSLNAGEKVTVSRHNDEVDSIAIPKAKTKHAASASKHSTAAASQKY